MQTVNIDPIRNHLMKTNRIEHNQLPDPEKDFRGLNPAYLKKEGERAYFVAALQTMLAVHISYLSIAWLAWEGHYVDGVMGSLIASWLWCRVIINARYAMNCNLEAGSSEEETKQGEDEQ